MYQNYDIILFICIVLNIFSGLIGYIIGKLNSTQGVYLDRPKSFFDKSKEDKIINSNIIIDDKKFVTDIKTDGLERKYDTLGDIKKTEDNISGSVSKLKNLKR